MSAEEEAAAKTIEQILSGELPGAEYLFPADPEKRQKNLITTTPEMARAALLRAVETMAQYLTLPYGMDKKAELGKAILECSQSFLLLDPTVDESGVPVGAQATAQAESTQETNAHKAGLDKEVAEHGAHLQANLAAHASGAAFKRAVDANGYVEPPRVQPNSAETGIAEKHKSQSQELKGARGDKPLPKPRVGA